MQPPRARPSHNRRPTAQLEIAAVINLGVALLTILLVRLTILAVAPGRRDVLTRVVLRVTDVAVWPARQVSPLQRELAGALTLGDLLTVLIIAVVWIVLVGVMTGWQAEDRRARSTRA